jgi:LCP family protein required for cell wall assembly
VLAVFLAVGAYTGFRVLKAIHALDPHAGLGDIFGLAGSGEDTPGTIAYKIKHGQRVNILMMGYGGAGHDGAYLTDSIMVISVQGTERVAMTSLPRDTFVRIKAFQNGGEYDGKVNAAYEIPISNGAFGRISSDYSSDWNGGGKLASKVIGDYIGQPIDYWVGVDFTAFKKLVDAVGGIDVVNPYPLDDDQYPLGETYRTMHIHFNAGPLHLSGDQALIYVRERHSDNDFGRSRRQQVVAAAIKDKAISIGAIPHLFDLLDALQDNVRTNMSINDLKTFAGIANNIKSDSTHRVSVDNTTFQYDLVNGYGYILLLRDHSGKTLQHFIANELPDPAVLREKANVQFSSSLNESSEGQNLAVIVSKLMGMIGFKESGPATVSSAPATTEIHDFSGGRDSKTVAWMQHYFGGTVIKESPHASGPPDVVVVLGRDFANAFTAEETPVYTPQLYTPPSNERPPAASERPAASSAPTAEPTPTPSRQPLPSPSSPCPPVVCRPSPSPTPHPPPKAEPSPSPQ